MSVREGWRRDVIDLALRRVAPERFAAAHPEIAEHYAPVLRESVRQAEQTRDGALLEDCLLLAAAFGDEPIDALVLARLLEQDWHTKHQDIARLLQRRRDPRAVDALSRVARHVPAYLDWDENRALAVQCLHALEDIGTPEAKQALRDLARDPDPVVSETAQRMVRRDRPPESAPADASPDDGSGTGG